MMWLNFLIDADNFCITSAINFSHRNIPSNQLTRKSSIEFDKISFYTIAKLTVSLTTRFYTGKISVLQVHVFNASCKLHSYL